MFILGKLKSYIIIAGLLGVAGFGLWKYYPHNQKIITAYAEENAKKELVINESKLQFHNNYKKIMLNYKNSLLKFPRVLKHRATYR